MAADHAATRKPNLARQLGLFDATMLVMGGIVGSGIFINPYVVAQQVHTPALILGAWIFGGVIGVGGAFIWAELAATLPEVGGQYAYLREAYHPAVAFLYGWVLLLVIQTGGMAAVAITFARYFLELTGAHSPDWIIAMAALATLTLINCLGVKSGGRTQSALMVMKIVAIAALVIAGLVMAGKHVTTATAAEQQWSLSSFGAAMVPVLFAYGGWQTANFLAAEVKEPKKNLPRGLLVAEMRASEGYRMPGHPVSTLIFVAICWWVVGNTIYRYPQNSLMGFALLLMGVPVYWFWSRGVSSRSVDVSRNG